MSTTNHPTAPDRLVVVGASAGGVEALSILVSTLPADFPAPIVLAQHLDPQWHSHLGHILQRRTTLPVRVIADHTPLRAGEVYVVPENRHVTLTDGFIEAREDDLGRPIPSLDLLLSSAAATYGNRLVAVILTGAGSNGAAGAIAVKRAGGTVIIQNPETARFPSMPLALPPTIVDVRADIQRIGPLLFALLTGSYLPQEDEQGEVLARLLEVLRVQQHIDAHKYQTAELLEHLGYRMLVTGSPTMSDYLAYLQAVPREAEELVQALLVTHTQFFRDPAAFGYLKDTLLPELLARARERDHTLRCWSAGCATGEEAYSLAMLLADLLGEELEQWRIKIFATDFSEEAITFARLGIYTEAALDVLPPAYRARFFARAAHGSYRVKKRLRQLVVFGRQDLTRTVPFSAIDLLLCRNVLSALVPQTQEFVLTQFAFSLYPGGYLLLGKDEAIRPAHALFEGVSRDWSAYRCIGSSFPLAPESAPGNPPAERAKRHGSAALAREREQPAEALPSLDLAQLQSYNERLFRSFPIGLIVIDRSYHIVTANNLARRLLRLPAEVVDQDFLHVTPGLPYAQVRGAIDAVLREGSMITLPEVEPDVLAGGSGRIVALAIAPLQVNSAHPELVTISVVDLTEQVLARKRLQAMQAEQAQLVDELGSANRRLSETNTALLASNEALEAANEDLILTQEEQQTGHEELETTHEELLVSLMEVEVMNEELQTNSQQTNAVSEALKQANADLQEQNGLLREERRRLTEIAGQAPYAFVVLGGPELRVESVSPRYEERLHGQPVLGRPLAEVAGGLFPADPAHLACLADEVYRQGAPRSFPGDQAGGEAAGGNGGVRPPAYMLVPAHTADGSVSGVIVYVLGLVAAENQASELAQPDATP